MKIQTSYIAGWAAVSMQWGAWAGSGMAVTHNLLPRIIKSGATALLDTCALVSATCTKDVADWAVHALQTPAA